MADACHNLQNATKDLCALGAFQKTISNLRELLSFMSLSTYTLDHYNITRNKHNVSHGLQSVGETRFATIYWSLESVLAGIDVFTEITRSPTLGIKSEVCPTTFYHLS